jgi:hypothetical protein
MVPPTLTPPCLRATAFRTRRGQRCHGRARKTDWALPKEKSGDEEATDERKHVRGLSPQQNRIASKLVNQLVLVCKKAAKRGPLDDSIRRRKREEGKIQAFVLQRVTNQASACNRPNAFVRHFCTSDNRRFSSCHSLATNRCLHSPYRKIQNKTKKQSAQSCGSYMMQNKKQDGKERNVEKKPMCCDTRQDERKDAKTNGGVVDTSRGRGK